MLDSNIEKLIIDKAEDLNNQKYLAEYVSCIIRKLSDFIDQKIELKIHEVTSNLDCLIGYFTTTLHTPLLPGLKLLRARAFDGEHYECDAAELSYISEHNKSRVTLGRLNVAEEPVYYGCIYFDDSSGGVNVVFSEIDAKPYQTVNILRSEAINEINVYFIGVYDYVLRNMRPYFVPEVIFKYFVEVYEFQKDNYSEDVFFAHQICDAFFSNILRRPEHGNLYKVTSMLSKLFLENGDIDGVVYTSVKAVGSPVIALKPKSVDAKLKHRQAECYQVERDYGYAFYRAKRKGVGNIKSNTIEW